MRAFLLVWVVVVACGPEIAPNAMQQQDEMQKLRSTAQSYPVEALHQLGVTDGQIDGVFTQWAAKKHQQITTECEQKAAISEKEPPPPPPKPEPTPEPDPTPNIDKIAKPWWCTNGTPGVCLRDRETCFGALGAGGRTDCYWRERAACLTYVRILDKKKAEWCASSFEECKTLRSFLAQKKDDIAQISLCEAK
jgi:hypothetical protein